MKQKIKIALKKAPVTARLFFKKYWLGIVIIGLATVIFFLPLIKNIDSYSDGGDVMFNAWTLERDHSCLKGDNCPSYVDANIYFPHKDTMLYSETQLSTGVLTFPLTWITDNPWFANNVWTIFSFFLSGFFTYLLAMYLSRGNQFVSITAGLIFAFAPFKMAAVSHLQNLSILYLPLALLFIFKFFDTKLKRYLVGLLVTLIILFYASWYQMVFASIAIIVVLVLALLLKHVKWKQVLLVFGTLLLAVIAVLPLALEFVRFSHNNAASFSVKDQTLYSSSLADYVLPYDGSILGKIFYSQAPNSIHNAYNLDSYSYHGIILYAIALFILGVIVFARRKKIDKKTRNLAVIFLAMAFVGFVISLGPLLKVYGDYLYGSGDIKFAIPLPWLIVDKLLPQLSFIRAIGRASVLTLVALCCLLALLPVIFQGLGISKRWRIIAYLFIGLFVIVELAPIHMVPMSQGSYSYNLKVPAVYQYIKQHKDINNIVILAADSDYPGSQLPTERAEWVLWAGYHNRNIFNGYSGYTPPTYFAEYADYKDLNQDDIPRMKSEDIRYVIVDKQLSTSDPELANKANTIMSEKIFEDDRYVLFKV